MSKKSGWERVVRVNAGAFLVAVLAAPGTGQVTSRVSVDSSGTQGDGPSAHPALSADGRYVAFYGTVTNLVGGDTNGDHDIFVRDRQSGVTERVSVDSSGAQGNGDSVLPAISADGRYVAFRSDASNLVAGDTNDALDVFVRDRQSGATERVSVHSSGAQGNGNSREPAISADGRYVAFAIDGLSLVGGVTNGHVHVYVRDRVAGVTELISVDSSGAPADGYSDDPAISADGRYVAFRSFALSLVGGDTNGTSDVFVRDRQSGTTERVSVHSSGAEGNDLSYAPVISADGRHVAFVSHATNLVGGDTNGAQDVFVRDRVAGATELVSVDSGGTQGNGDSLQATISADGRCVAFRSIASNLVGGDTNGTFDVYVRDRVVGATERVSVASSGAQGNSGSYDSALSADGRCVFFASNATNLVGGDTNGAPDVFVRDRDPTGFTSLCHPGIDSVIGCPCGQPSNPAGGCANHGAGATTGAALSASGVAYVSADTLLLTTSNHRSPAIGVLNVFFSFKPGALTNGTASGAGVRCTGAGDLRRLYTMQVFGGAGSKPGMGDSSVSVKSASFPGHSIAPGETRYYFNVYRDGQASGPCGNSAISTNLTNMGSIAWSL